MEKPQAHHFAQPEVSILVLLEAALLDRVRVFYLLYHGVFQSLFYWKRLFWKDIFLTRNHYLIVSILVLLEAALLDSLAVKCRQDCIIVSILVLLEAALLVANIGTLTPRGLLFQSLFYWKRLFWLRLDLLLMCHLVVSILVLLEAALLENRGGRL